MTDRERLSQVKLLEAEKHALGDAEVINRLGQITLQMLNVKGEATSRITLGGFVYAFPGAESVAGVATRSLGSLFVADLSYPRGLYTSLDLNFTLNDQTFPVMWFASPVLDQAPINASAERAVAQFNQDMQTLRSPYRLEQ